MISAICDRKSPKRVDFDIFYKIRFLSRMAQTCRFQFKVVQLPPVIFIKKNFNFLWSKLELKVDEKVKDVQNSSTLTFFIKSDFHHILMKFAHFVEKLFNCSRDLFQRKISIFYSEYLS